MTARVVLGVDHGGTDTRAMIADIDGRVLAYAETGGSNPNHHPILSAPAPGRNAAADS